MAKYHVGCGIIGIYAGTLNKKGDTWTRKSDVTDEAIIAVAQFLLEHEEAMVFNYQGKKYRLAVEQAESESHEIEKINCKTTKCENCINHNDRDYEPQERS